MGSEHMKMQPNCGLALPCLDETFARVSVRQLVGFDRFKPWILWVRFALPRTIDRQRVGLYGKVW